MEIFKSFVGGCLLLVLFTVNAPLPVSASGIPVFDGANMAQAVQQVIHMVEQIEKLQSQLQVAENQLKQMSDVRNMGGIIGSIYDNDMDIDYEDALEAADILSSNEFDLTDSAADLFDKQNRAAGKWKGRSDKFIDQAIDRFTELEKLVQKVNAAPEQKDVLDLQARIQAEQVLLQNEAIKLQMMESQANAEQALFEQSKRQKLIDMAGDPENFRF